MEEDFIARIVDMLIIQTGGNMASQAMDKKKRDQVKFNSGCDPDDYENGKLRDKKQKKLNEFIEEK